MNDPSEPVTLFESYQWRSAQMSDAQAKGYDVQRQALDRYRSQAWADARTLFTEAAQLDPDDKVPALYLSRIAHYELHPPGDEWDGVWTMASK